MENIFVKKLYYCPIKSLSFNKIDKFIVKYKIGVLNDRCLAFTRGVTKKIANSYINNTHKRKLNCFLTLRNTPYLKRYNFIFDNKKNIKMYSNKKILFETNLDDHNQVKIIEQYIENLNTNILKPIFLIYNNKIPFFDTNPQISVSLINLSTIRHIERKINKKINFERFRANIYIDNLKPWHEFNLINKYIYINKVKFLVNERISRCSITNINPKNYNIDINFPNTLNKLFGHIDLGIYLTPQNSGIINTNDPIYI